MNSTKITVYYRYITLRSRTHLSTSNEITLAASVYVFVTYSFYRNRRPVRNVFVMSQLRRKRIQAVTFDAMNTLVLTKEPIGTTYARIASSLFPSRKFDHSQIHQDFKGQFKAMCKERPCYGFGTGEGAQKRWWLDVVGRTFAKHLENEPDEAKQALQEKLYEHYNSVEPWFLENDTLPVLKRMKSKGLKVAIVSNWDSRLRNVLTSLLEGEESLIDAYFLSGELGLEKPDPEIFRYALKVLGVFEPELLLHVGDSVENDYNAAIKLGCRSLLLSSQQEDEQIEIPPPGVDFIRKLVHIFGRDCFL